MVAQHGEVNGQSKVAWELMLSGVSVPGITQPAIKGWCHCGLSCHGKMRHFIHQGMKLNFVRSRGDRVRVVHLS